MMKIIFMGTPRHSADLLQLLIKSQHEIVCVVTQPDRPKGRGKQIAFSPVKELAIQKGLPLEQPEKVKNNKVFASTIKSLSPDLIVIVAYGQIIPKEILDIPKYGCINVHASLLPKYRGAAPVQWSILNGETETGVTIMKIDEMLDTGDIILQEKVSIGEDDSSVLLMDKLFNVGGKLMQEAVSQIEKGTAGYLKQNDAEATFAPSLTKESGEIDWRKSAIEIHNRVRAMNPWPVAHTFFREKRLKILETKLHVIDFETKYKDPGTIIEIVKNVGFIVATGNGHILVSRVQIEGKKAMKSSDFVNGHDVKIAETLPN
jgi:methionyl-tRNA formyltransferase